MQFLKKQCRSVWSEGEFCKSLESWAGGALENHTQNLMGNSGRSSEGEHFDLDDSGRSSEGEHSDLENSGTGSDGEHSDHKR